MRYYLDVDYFLFFEDFPHMGVPGVIVGNSDGTVNIYINTLYSPERQDKALRHELRHLAKNHLFIDWLTISEKELEADDLDDPSCIFAENYAWVECADQPCAAPASRPDRIPDVFAEAPPGTIPLFQSMDGLLNYMLAMREQYRRENK